MFNKNQTKEALFKQSTFLSLFCTIIYSYNKKLFNTNWVDLNSKKECFFFYKIFKVFLAIATKNNNIKNFSLDKAKEKL